MCEITKKYWDKGREEGLAEGRAEGGINMLMELVKKNILSVKVAAEQAGMTEAAFKKMAML